MFSIKKLSALGLDSYIDFIVTSEEAGIEKPDSHLFDICVEKAGFSANECAFIGDSLKKRCGRFCKMWPEGNLVYTGKRAGNGSKTPGDKVI